MNEHDIDVEPESLRQFDATQLLQSFEQDRARAEVGLAAGLTIEEAWLSGELIRGEPTQCLLVDRYANQPVKRVTRLRIAPAEALVGELSDRLARNFRFPNRKNTVFAALKDAYFEPAPPIIAGVDVGGQGQAIVLVSSDPRGPSFRFQLPAPDRSALGAGSASGAGSGSVGIDATPTGDQGVWEIKGADLAKVLVFCFVLIQEPMARSPDIFDPSVRLETDPSKGAPLDVVWHGNWEIAGVLYCLIAEERSDQESDRIPYKFVLSATDLIAVLERWKAAQPQEFYPSVMVTLGPGRAHVVNVSDFPGGRVVYHDPWPGESLLTASSNDLGIAAKKKRDRWSITREELSRCIVAAMVPPYVLAEQQGLEWRRSLAEVLRGELGTFFHLTETGRSHTPDGDLLEVQPGAFRDKTLLQLLVDDTGLIVAALAGVDRAWLTDSPPLAIDLLKSFAAAVICPPDEEAAQLMIQGIWAVARGQAAVGDALSAGPPHLLGQARTLVLAVLGAMEGALATFPFTRIVARNTQGERPWLYLGIEIASRTVGPWFIGAELPAPWNSTIELE